MPLRVIAVVSLTAAIVMLSAIQLGADAELPGPAEVTAAAPPAAQPSGYRQALADGQPIAILRRDTALRVSPGGRRLATLRTHTQFGSPRVAAVTSEHGRWLRVLSEQLPNGHAGWIPGAAANVVASPWTVRADLSQRTVEVRRAGRLVRRFSVAIGRPATPTPTGRFAVTDKLHIKGGSRAYGCCALALSGHQPHIEPGWQGGDRLAIHGTGDPGSIGAAASFGCLRAREHDARWLIGHVLLGSIVEIRE